MSSSVQMDPAQGGSGDATGESAHVHGAASKSGFNFQDFFQSTQDKPAFHQKPPPPAESLRPRRSSNTGGSGSSGDEAWWQRLPAIVPIVAWIATSSFVILQNAALLKGGYSHPIALTTIHLAFQTVATRILRRTTSLVDGARELEATGKMNQQSWLRQIVPIGVLFSLSLVLSNTVYLTLSVSFIQMIKAVTPVVVLLVSAAAGLKQLSQKLLMIVSCISIGVGIASFGEIKFEWSGFLIQLLAIGIESCRLVLIQILLQGWGMSPLVSLYYFAPVCLAINSALLLPVEGVQPFYDAVQTIGIPTLALNASMTFLLNLSSVWLIGRASGLVLTLAGVVKDILLIVGAWAVMGSTITNTQIFGYAIALSGLVWFKMQ